VWGHDVRVACGAAVLVPWLAFPACRSQQSSGGPAKPASATPVRSSAAASPRVLDAGSDDAKRDAPLDAASDGLAPLAADSELIPLEVEGFRDAVVSLPIGATTPRPVVIALHGNYDRPEWQCEVWRSLVGSKAFVACPRGIPRADAPKSEDRWTYGATAKTEAECLAVLDALKQKYPEHASIERVVFSGFSLGAIQGRTIVSKHAARFRRVVLTEGGYEAWSLGLAKKWASGGVERVLFACGQTACTFGARAAARVAERGGITVRVASGGNVGHTYDGKVAAAIADEWAWLVAAEPMWDVVAD